MTARLRGAIGAAGVASISMASDMLCCPGGTDRFDKNGTGPGPGTAASAEGVRAVPHGPRSVT